MNIKNSILIIILSTHSVYAMHLSKTVCDSYNNWRAQQFLNNLKTSPIGQSKHKFAQMCPEVQNIVKEKFSSEKPEQVSKFFKKIHSFITNDINSLNAINRTLEDNFPYNAHINISVEKLVLLSPEEIEVAQELELSYKLLYLPAKGRIARPDINGRDSNIGYWTRETLIILKKLMQKNCITVTSQDQSQSTDKIKVFVRCQYKIWEKIFTGILLPCFFHYYANRWFPLIESIENTKIRETNLALELLEKMGQGSFLKHELLPLYRPYVSRIGFELMHLGPFISAIFLRLGLDSFYERHFCFHPARDYFHYLIVLLTQMVFSECTGCFLGIGSVFVHMIWWLHFIISGNEFKVMYVGYDGFSAANPWSDEVVVKYDEIPLLLNSWILDVY